MTKPSPTRRAIRSSEEGYILLFAIFLMALVVISLAIAAPKVAKSIQRDRDLETFHRGLQYRRAIQLYYRKFHAYPPNADALVKTNEIRFLRNKYIDPITGKADWKPVLFGQNKTPTAMGFFGQPLAGGATSIAGIGPSGGNGLGGSGGGSILPGGISQMFGSSSSSSTSGTSPTDTSGNPNAGPSSPGTNAPGTTTTGGLGSSTGSSTGSDQSGQNGQTFGGAGIIGFSPASTKKSILIYKKKDHYNEWEFTYDPISEMKTISGGNGAGIGQPASSTTTPVGTSPFANTFGSNNNTNTNSNNTGTNSNPSPQPQ
ncbi:MAG: hypothetical protein ABSD59_06970 [Terracidiphilus sp.]|jgi:type II secretory pathway pseudopilin PulG